MMFIACPKCQTRYEVPDDRLKPKGTKVLCQRCQNIFLVFPGHSAAQLLPSEPAPSHSSMALDKTTVKRPPSSHEDDESTYVPRGGIEVSIPGDSTGELWLRTDVTQTSFRPDQVNPNNRKRKIVEPPPQSEPIQEKTGEIPRPSALKEDSAPQLELELLDQDRGWKRLKKFFIGGVVLILIGAAVYFYPKMNANKFVRPSRSNTTTSSASFMPPDTQQRETLTPTRPSRWYEDEPSYFHDFIAQSVSRSPDELSQPEMRGQLAEAMISEGVLTGTESEVAKGLSYATSLVLQNPHSNLPLYALSAFDEWNEDIPALEEIVRKWPSENQSDPEYKLASFIIEAKLHHHPRAALQKAKNLLTVMPLFQRANTWAVAIGLDYPEDAIDVFGKKEFEVLVRKYRSHHDSIRKPVPNLYQELDKKLLNRTPSMASRSSRN